MITENSLVIYKNKPALVKETTDGKFSIFLQDGSSVKVRDKDIELIHPGPVKDLNGILIDVPPAAVRDVWELLSGEGEPVSLKELAALVCGEYNPASAYAAYCLIKDGLYFSGTLAAIKPKSSDEAAVEEEKRAGKQRDTDERQFFIKRVKACLRKPLENPLSAADLRFMQDVEALAYGKSVKSRTMKELGLSETPVDAHALLLNTGLWKESINPHPARFGLSLNHPEICPQAPSFNDRDRRDLCRLTAFAIDSPWSLDPDDAVSIEKDEDGRSVLYVHIADPASVIMPGSPVERDARDRGATLYLPEDTVRMLADEALEHFALGLKEKSAALTFKMTLNEDCGITQTEIFPSIVKVTRLTYEEADRMIDSADTEGPLMLRALYDFAQRNCKRRTIMGAVNIELPETHITVVDGKPDIKPVVSYRSNSLVRECMISAGEGAGNWAASHGIAFPYISQDVDIQGSIPQGLAGSWYLRKCMRPRVLSTKPGRHQGLGLDTYSQVTSPLRRYTDLLAHMQIRAFLRGEKPLGVDEVSARLGFCEAAVTAAVQAERASNNHWTYVYLSGKKDSVWDAVALEKKGNRWAVLIPSLALETQAVLSSRAELSNRAGLQNVVSPNDSVALVLKSASIPKTEAVFLQSFSG